MTSSHEQVCAYVQEQFHLTVALDTPWNDTGLDSMQLLDVVFHVERQYGITVTDQALREIATLGDLVQVVERSRSHDERFS